MSNITRTEVLTPNGMTYKKGKPWKYRDYSIPETDPKAYYIGFENNEIEDILCCHNLMHDFIEQDCEFDEERGVYVHSVTWSEWGDGYGNEIPLIFCPICGRPFKYITVATVEEHREEIIEQKKSEKISYTLVEVKKHD